MELLTILDFKFFSSSFLVLLTEKQINTLNLKTFYRIVKFTNQIKVSTERVGTCSGHFKMIRQPCRG